MPLLINTDELSELELGYVLHHALAIGEDEVVPWHGLEDHERDYYVNAAQDFVRGLIRLQARTQNRIKRRLWFYDSESRTVKSDWLLCPKLSEPHRWVRVNTREKAVLTLGSTCFERELDAWLYAYEKVKYEQTFHKQRMDTIVGRIKDLADVAEEYESDEERIASSDPDL